MPPSPSKPGLRLGELLVRAGYVTQDQVEVALHAAAEQGCRIGTALVRLGYLDAITLARALGKLRGIRWLEPSELAALDSEVARKLPAQTAHHRRAVPVRWLAREGHKPDVLVAFDVPPDVGVVDEIAFVLGARVTPCITPEDVLDEALDRYYPMPKPASYRMVELEPSGVTGAFERSPEAVLRDCRAELELHHEGCVLLVDREQWRSISSRKPVTGFVIEYVRRHHDPSGQLTVRCHRQRHLLAHFTGYGRPVDARREPPGATLGREDPLFLQRIEAPSGPARSARAPAPPMSGAHAAPPMSGAHAAPPMSGAHAAPPMSGAQAAPSWNRPVAPPPGPPGGAPRGPQGPAVVAGRPATPARTPPPRVVAGSPVPARPDPIRASFEEPPPPPVVSVMKAVMPTHRDSVKVTPIDPTAKPQNGAPVAAPPPEPTAPATPPAPLPAPSKPKVELPSFPAPEHNILTAKSDGLQDSLSRALEPSPPATKPSIVEALRAATTSRAVADVLVEALAPNYEAVLVLVVKHESAMGWCGQAPNVGRDFIESVLVPLSEPSVFARVKQGCEIVIEAPGTAEQPVHRRLWKLLGLSTPTQVAAAPVMLGDRLVNIVYVHPKAGAALPDDVEAELKRLTAAAQDAFARIIQAKKG